MTILTQIALFNLEQKIRERGGEIEKGIEAFLSQNDREGWMLPETLRLADYGLGHDEHAEYPQPVASRLGPRFYDWQLTQSAEESWRECHRHARNILGEEAYNQLRGNNEANAHSKYLTGEGPLGSNQHLIRNCQDSQRMLFGDRSVVRTNNRKRK